MGKMRTALLITALIVPDACALVPTCTARSASKKVTVMTRNAKKFAMLPTSVMMPKRKSLMMLFLPKLQVVVKVKKIKVHKVHHQKTIHATMTAKPAKMLIATKKMRTALLITALIVPDACALVPTCTARSASKKVTVMTKNAKKCAMLPTSVMMPKRKSKLLITRDSLPNNTDPLFDRV